MLHFTCSLLTIQQWVDQQHYLMHVSLSMSFLNMKSNKSEHLDLSSGIHPILSWVLIHIARFLQKCCHGDAINSLSENTCFPSSTFPTSPFQFSCHLLLPHKIFECYRILKTSLSQNLILRRLKRWSGTIQLQLEGR